MPETKGDRDTPDRNGAARIAQYGKEDVGEPGISDFEQGMNDDGAFANVVAASAEKNGPENN